MNKNDIKSYKDLIAWQKAMLLVKNIYEIAKTFPKEEIYALTSQIKRSAVSIPSNISEGSSKRSINEFIRFLNISYGSLCELETQIQIAEIVGYINSSSEIMNQTSELGKILNGLISSLENKNISN